MKNLIILCLYGVAIFMIYKANGVEGAILACIFFILNELIDIATSLRKISSKSNIN